MEEAEQMLEDVSEDEFRRRVALDNHWGDNSPPIQRFGEVLVQEIDRKVREQHDVRVRNAAEESAGAAQASAKAAQTSATISQLTNPERPWSRAEVLSKPSPVPSSPWLAGSQPRHR